MDIIIDCPLGSKCEEIRENKIHRCGWYTEMAGMSPDGEQIKEWRCSMAWLPILMTENAQQIRGMTSATESFRNESVKGQTEFNKIMMVALKNKQKAISNKGV